MKSFSRKTLKAVVVLLILLIGSGLFLLFQSGYYLCSSKSSDELPKLEYLAQVYEALKTEEWNSSKWFRENNQDNLFFMQAALRRLVIDGKYTGPETFRDGVVVQLQGDQVLFPEETPQGLLGLTSQMIRAAAASTQGELESYIKPEQFAASFLTASLQNEDGEENHCLIYAIPVTEELYYISWISFDELNNYIKLHSNAQTLLQEAEAASNGHYVVLKKGQDGKTKILEVPDTIDDISNEDLEAEIAGLIDSGQNIGTISPGYLCVWKEIHVPDADHILAFLTPYDPMFLSELPRIAILLLAMLLILGSLTVYMTSVQKCVKNRTLPIKDLEAYHPKKVRKKVLSAGIVGALLILGTGAFVQATGMLQDETLTKRAEMSKILNYIKENQEKSDQETKTEEEKWYVYYGEKMADLMSAYPQLCESEALQEFCDILKIDYIMLFDSKGRETSCNLDYSNFRLGTGQGENSADFRRLLQGVPSVVHQPSEDPVTGLNRQMIGISIPEDSKVEPHRAMIMALLPERTQRTRSKWGIDDQLHVLTGEGEIYFGADSKTGEIRHSSDRSLLNMNITNYDIPMDSLRDGYMGYASIQGARYCAITTLWENVVFYYAESQDRLFSSVLPFALTAAGCYVLSYLIMALLLLSGFKDEDYHECILAEEEGRGALESNRQRLAGFIRKWDSSYVPWNDKTPEEKTRIAFHLILFVGMLILFCFEASGWAEKVYQGVSVFRFILFGNWMRGVNLFSISGILVLSVVAFLSVVVIKAILRFFQAFLDKKGETICKLLHSFVDYVAVLVVLYCSLEYLGLSPGTVLASLGIVGIAISLGAKDMITDIFAGISIVFEDAFKVGEYINADGFRGRVESIGIRMTRIVGSSGNIKIINNKDIRNIINLNRMDSEVKVYLKISAQESLEEVRDLLENKLPEIGQLNDKIVSGPYYAGVSELTGNQITILITAKCQEQDLHPVTGFLNEEIYKLLSREGIAIQTVPQK